MFSTIIFNPLYNALVFLLGKFSFLDAGMVIIVFTIFVKVVLFPLSKKSARTQILMKTVEPELNAIKEKHKDNKEEQARQTMALYKTKGINPFAGIVVLFIQIPILLALYQIFSSHGLTEINTSILYSFIHVPEVIKTSFLGLVDITSKNIPLAVVTAVTQYIQSVMVMPKAQKKEKMGASVMGDMNAMLQFQMKYVFPIMMLFIAYNATAAVAIYFITSNVFMIGQEYVVRKQLEKEGLKKA
jgi:YidC/Oxa1 family membrane protein insertase